MKKVLSFILSILVVLFLMPTTFALANTTVKDGNETNFPAFYVMSPDKESIDINVKGNVFIDPTLNYVVDESIYNLDAAIMYLDINNIEVNCESDNTSGDIITDISGITESINIRRSLLHEGINTIILSGYSEIYSKLNPLDTRLLYGSETFTIIVYKQNIVSSKIS